jgi:hypothetical protein
MDAWIFSIVKEGVSSAFFRISETTENEQNPKIQYITDIKNRTA